MKKSCFLAALIVSAMMLHTNLAKAQSLDPKIDRFEVGGQFGINVQNKMGAVEFSPVIGYRVTKFFTVNVGVIGQYMWNKDNDMSEWSYGFSAGARLVLFDLIFVEGRGVWNPRVINYKSIDLKEYSTDNLQLWAGIGYRQRLSSNTYAHAGIFYDFIPLIKNDETLVNDYNPRVEAGVTYTF